MPYKHKGGQRDAVMTELIEKHGAAELARRIQPNLLTRQAVFLWPRVPERWVERVAEEFGMSCHQIRPDLFARNGKRIYDRTVEPPPLLPAKS